MILNNKEICLCFVAYKNKEDLEKEKNFFKLNKQIKNNKKIKQEDINKIVQLLKNYTIIEPDILGEFMEYPIKKKEILNKYFEFYSHYYEPMPSKEIIDKILDVYNKYDYDLSDKFDKWFNYWNKKVIKKEAGCLNIQGKKFFKLQKRKILFYKFNDLIKLKKKLKEELCLVNKLNFYKNNIKDTIISDIKIINYLIKLKKQGWIIKGEILKK